MKNSVVYLFSLLLLTGMMGCEKTGPTGPPGASGNSVIIEVDSFSVQPSQWVLIANGYYKYIHTDTAITQQIMTSGNVNLFIKDYTFTTNYNAWYGMPDVVAGGSGWRYSYDLNTITLYADNFPNGLPRPYRFKVVIMK